jgi:hypothetical protein
LPGSATGTDDVVHNLVRDGPAGNLRPDSFGRIVLAAKTAGRTMLFEATHKLDSSFDPATVLLQSIAQIHTRPVADIAAQS